MDKNKCVCTVNLFVYIVNLRRKKKGVGVEPVVKTRSIGLRFLCVYCILCVTGLQLWTGRHEWGPLMGKWIDYYVSLLFDCNGRHCKRCYHFCFLFNVPTAGVVTTATKWSRMDNIIAGFQGIGRSTQTRLQGATSIGTQLCPGHSGMQIWVDFHWNVSFILLLVLEKLGVSVACQINSPCYHIDDSLLV